MNNFYRTKHSKANACTHECIGALSMPYFNLLFLLNFKTSEGMKEKKMHQDGT